LDLLAEVGFKVERDIHNRLFIAASNNEIIPFTEQEVDFLKKTILTIGKKSKLVDGILHKIQYIKENDLQTEGIFKAHLSQLVELISYAIVEKKQLLIKGYYSINSETISNRLVEPICFTDNYNSLCAYEIKSKDNKYFNIERMSNAEVLNSDNKFEEMHKYHRPDIFGFQGKEMDKEVEMEMSMRATQLLKEEYPMSIPFIKKKLENGNYYFKASVQDFKAPARYVLGFYNAINVIGSKEFRQYLNRILKTKGKPI